MTTNERQQRMAERILEDESLRGDLEDDAATALVDWASAQAVAVAADPDRADAVVEAQVQAIRKAAHAAALSGETEPKRLIALAAAGLGASPDVAKVESHAMATGASVEEKPARPAQPAADLPAVVEAPAPVPAAPPATLPTAGAPVAKQPSGTAPKPTKPGGPRPRRKRSRLARFFKHLLGGR